MKTLSVFVGWALILVAVVSFASGCALSPEQRVGVLDIVNSAGEGATIASQFLPPPWNWVALAGGTLLAGLGHGKGKIASFNKGRKAGLKKD
jgi:hypothetical protein